MVNHKKMSDSQKKRMSLMMKGKSKNQWEILDQGILKSVPEVKMVKQNMVNAMYACEFLRSDKRILTRMVTDKDTFEDKEEEYENESYVEPTQRYINFKNKFYDSVYTSVLKQEYTVYNWKNYLEQDISIIKMNFGWQEMLDYMGIIPFTPSVMINISPDWKCAPRRSNKCKTKYLKDIVENYMKEGDRYDYYSYVIENGANGEHIHAHIVGHINPKLSKSVNTHLAKGNHTQQLKKHADGIKGMKGIIKGVSVQKTFLRTEEIVKDKLDYLIEEKKPEGHKNKSVIQPGRVDVVL